MKFKFIISDLDGVIRHYPPERNLKIEKKYGLSEGVLLELAFQKDKLLPAICGSMSDEEWRDSIELSLGQLVGPETARLAMQEWNNFSGMIDHEYLDYMNVRFANIPVVILTNGTTRLSQDLKKLGIENHFFRIFNSADIGYCKPDQKIFKHVLQELGCQGHEVLFIDDSLSHVDSAKALGMITHHYQSLNLLKLNFE